MRPRISIRGSVRPSVRWSVRMSVTPVQNTQISVVLGHGNVIHQHKQSLKSSERQSILKSVCPSICQSKCHSSSACSVHMCTNSQDASLPDRACFPTYELKLHSRPNNSLTKVEESHAEENYTPSATLMSN